MEVGVGVTGILQQGVVLLAHPRLAVVAGHIVPVHAIIVEVIEDGQARLLGAALLQLSVVGLGQTDAAALGPIVLLTVGGWRELLQLRCPEPTVHVGRLQIGTFTATEVALATACPNVFDLKPK